VSGHFLWSCISGEFGTGNLDNYYFQYRNTTLRTHLLIAGSLRVYQREPYDANTTYIAELVLGTYSGAFGGSGTNMVPVSLTGATSGLSAGDVKFNSTGSPFTGTPFTPDGTTFGTSQLAGIIMNQLGTAPEGTMWVEDQILCGRGIDIAPGRGIAYRSGTPVPAGGQLSFAVRLLVVEL
jgi:hypothetical protein